MSKQYVHARTCVYNINYHIVWCVKYRRKVLTGAIVDRLYEILDMVGKE
ncbi:MAG: transposase, partial [Solobacterium sp.]|nr:transposase [Solobacterium sp.]